MNQTSPVSTGAAAITGAMLGGCITWGCQALKLPIPPAEVAGTMGAILLAAGHAVAVRFFSKPTDVPKQ
ncbi:hypothetical protein [Pararobbsia silviterrae]|uniref:hypothetical protein n=1 Tax=Pararobbsia silviterrae TaxID=1792498 RepID=UPI001314B8A2|nr:hypothetical protein [Pararobbsia silviterrae]